MHLFTLFGTSIAAHPLFLGLLAVVALAGYPREALVVLGALLTHEVGHLVAGKAVRAEIERITLWPFGGVARNDTPPADAFSEGLLAASGPIGNLILIALGGLADRGGLLDPSLYAFFWRFNLAMIAINLVPALPLDGGRLGRALLSPRLGYRRATALLHRAGAVIGTGLIVAGPAGMVLGRATAGLAAAGFFILAAAVLERDALVYQAYTQLFRRRVELRSGGVLRGNLLVALGDRTVKEVLKSFEPHAFQVVAVLDPVTLGRLGVLTEAQVLEALEANAFNATLASLLSPPPDGRGGC
ncbi:MAG TPA: hypothetical protein VGL40_03720 [Bacillota bacterium]|jgi:stage IV sporulation protein FB